MWDRLDDAILVSLFKETHLTLPERHDWAKGAAEQTGFIWSHSEKEMEQRWLQLHSQSGQELIGTKWETQATQILQSVLFFFELSFAEYN